MENTLKSLTKKKISKHKIAKAPETQGVYLFWSSHGVPLYVGKANNLRRRVSSYISTDVSLKTAQLMREATHFSVIRVNSELEALLLEAKLVKKFLPKFNIQLRDDKHPLYIKITKEEYPRVLTARKIEEEEKPLAFFGPFPSSSNVKTVLKLLRQLFPYSQHFVSKRSCLYSQIGLCDPCPSRVESEEDPVIKNTLRRKYKANIKNLRKVLSGDVLGVRNDFVKEMTALATSESFEEAAKVKHKLEALDYITQPITPTNYFLQNPYFFDDVRRSEQEELQELVNTELDNQIKNLERIECYDIAHLAGNKPTASMVTFTNGEADKQFYRHFKIRQKKGNDDIASMSEVAKRRAKYLATWGVPDLIIVDGGKVQTKTFFNVFNLHGIPVVGLAKRFETLIFLSESGKFTEVRVPRGNARNLLQRLRNEAHRFARRYHHTLVHKDFLEK